MAQNEYDAQIQKVLDRLENQSRAKTIRVNFSACRAIGMALSSACVIASRAPVLDASPVLSSLLMVSGIAPLWFVIDQKKFRFYFNSMLSHIGVSAPAGRLEGKLAEGVAKGHARIEQVIESWGGVSKLNLTDVNRVVSAATQIQELTKKADIDKKIKSIFRETGIESAFRKAKLSGIAQNIRAPNTTPEPNKPKL